jgi:serine/threonine-protein kinase HipA
MKRIFVWVRRADASVRLVGELATSTPDSSRGHFESEFEYAPAWISEPGAFPLDPVSLPLETTRRFRAELLYPPLAVFDDALPDDWGRRLLAVAITAEGGRPTLPEMLLRMRGGGTGALLFTEADTAPHSDQSVPSTALAQLLAAAEKFEAGTLPPGDEFRRLLEGSSRAGGARPKALVHHGDVEWLAKFPSRVRDEGFDVVGLEATCLVLARRAGLVVPDSRLQTLGTRRVLLVQRFDVTALRGRHHMVSLRTLCKERPGIYMHSYSDLAQLLRKHSAAPIDDLAALYRHMVFNAAIGNVDDHLKNFWMLARAGGFRLAPAFDLVPDVSGRADHTLSFLQGFACPSRADMMTLATQWGVPTAAQIIDDVINATADFATTARQLGVRSQASLQRACDDVRRRTLLLSR